MYTIHYLLGLLGVTLIHQVTVFSNTAINDIIPDSFMRLAADNSLWTSLMKNCRASATLECVEKNMYTYLKQTLDYPYDFEMTSFMKFMRNSNDYKRLVYTNGSDYEPYHVHGDDDYDGPRSSIEMMTRAFHDQTVKFLMTHDTEVQLPERVFEESTLKLSPRSFEENGVLFKLEIIPKEVSTGQVQGRFLIKKLKKYITEKLLYAFLAIMLVVKLVSVKLLFLAPMMMGMAAAKKLFVKILLFLFPALHHIFKWCPYAPHGPKFHHHQHKIAHIHHVKPHVFKSPGHIHHGHGPHGGVEIIAPHANGPPTFHHPHKRVEEISPYSHGPPSLHHYHDHPPPHKPFYNPHEDDLGYFSGGPSLSNHFINHRQDENTKTNKESSGRPLTSTDLDNSIGSSHNDLLLKARLQKEKLRIQEENAKLHEELKQAIKVKEKLKQQAVVYNPQVATPHPFLQNSLSNQNQWQVTQVQNHQISQQQLALHQASTITYDKFYSPILEKIDKILIELGINDEPCRERLICSMYKNPVKYSPHSNLLSAELSRDSSELQKPTSTNAAVIRFYRYVQAARDGQDKRECLRLYAACSINTEK